MTCLFLKDLGHLTTRLFLYPFFFLLWSLAICLVATNIFSPFALCVLFLKSNVIVSLSTQALIPIQLAYNLAIILHIILVNRTLLKKIFINLGWFSKQKILILSINFCINMFLKNNLQKSLPRPAWYKWC